jgi:hypothetical protein
MRRVSDEKDVAKVLGGARETEGIPLPHISFRSGKIVF